MGKVLACSPSWNVFTFLLKIPLRPFFDGDAGGEGEGKGTSVCSWKLERFGCWSKTVERTVLEENRSSMGVLGSCAGVSGRLSALLILDHMLVVMVWLREMCVASERGRVGGRVGEDYSEGSERDDSNVENNRGIGVYVRFRALASQARSARDRVSGSHRLVVNLHLRSSHDHSPVEVPIATSTQYQAIDLARVGTNSGRLCSLFKDHVSICIRIRTQMLLCHCRKIYKRTHPT